MNIFQQQRAATKAASAAVGATVGIAVRQGAFAVTATRKEKGRFITEQLTGWQSHADCMAHVRALGGLA